MWQYPNVQATAKTRKLQHTTRLRWCRQGQALIKLEDDVLYNENLKMQQNRGSLASQTGPVLGGCPPPQAWTLGPTICNILHLTPNIYINLG